LPFWNRILSIRCVFKNRTALGMIQSIYYYNVSLRHISYLKPSQYLLYVTSNGELYSWYMFVLLSQPRSNQPSNHSAYSFAVTQPHAPISRQYILTAMETENSAECAEDRKDEHVAEKVGCSSLMAIMWLSLHGRRKEMYVNPSTFSLQFRNDDNLDDDDVDEDNVPAACTNLHMRATERICNPHTLFVCSHKRC